MTFLIGDTILAPEQLELRRDGVRVALEPQAFDVLVYLVDHRDRVVPKEELMDEVWGGRFVSETAVTSRIKQVRRALGDDGQSQACVRTYHGRGYRFVANVVVADPTVGLGTSPSSAADGAELQSTQTEEQGTSQRGSGPAPQLPVLSCSVAEQVLQFQLSGQGPPDLLVLPATSSLVADWDDADEATLLSRLGAMARVIRCQQPSPSLRIGAADVLVILDAAAAERAVILAEGRGAVLAVQLAAHTPDRVAGVVLFRPALSADHSPEVPADVRALLERVSAPTLVLHRSSDPQAPMAVARAIAAQIPNAEFVALPGDAHELRVDPDPVLARVGDFISDVAADQAAGRNLSALVGLHRGDVASLASVLVQLGGRLRQGPEHSVIVSFDGPANALTALASRRARGLRDDVGIGLAIDEVPRDSWLVSGHGVDVARLFAEHAQPGEVLLPNVIKHLLAGSGLRVETLTPLDLPHVGLHPVHRWLPPS